MSTVVLVRYGGAVVKPEQPGDVPVRHLELVGQMVVRAIPLVLSLDYFPGGVVPGGVLLLGAATLGPEVVLLDVPTVVPTAAAPVPAIWPAAANADGTVFAKKGM